MTNISLASSKLLAGAAQMAVDSIGAIDQQVQAAQAIHVDPGALPGLAADLTSLNATLAEWPDTIRPFAISNLKAAVTVDTAALATWPGVNRQDQTALLEYAGKLGAAVQTSSGAITRLDAAVTPFRMAIDQSASRLPGDLQAVSEQLASEQHMAQMLAQQAQDQQAKIQYYQANPWRLIADGLGMDALTQDFTTIINAENAAQAALSQLQQLEPQMAQLAAAGARFWACPWR